MTKLAAWPPVLSGGDEEGGTGTICLICITRVREPASEPGATSAASLSPNGRRGRQASPHAQGRDMEYFVGIDVAKDRLDVHLRPSGETFAVARDGEGVARLVERLRTLVPRLVVTEATGGTSRRASSATCSPPTPRSRRARSSTS